MSQNLSNNNQFVREATEKMVGNQKEFTAALKGLHQQMNEIRKEKDNIQKLEEKVSREVKTEKTEPTINQQTASTLLEMMASIGARNS